MRAKQPRLRLDPEAYRQLCREVLERDGWRCQSCGCIEGFQVHHIQPRGRLGDDSAEDPIALSALRAIKRPIGSLSRVFCPKRLVVEDLLRLISHSL